MFYGYGPILFGVAFLRLYILKDINLAQWLYIIQGLKKYFFIKSYYTRIWNRENLEIGNIRASIFTASWHYNAWRIS